MVAGSDDVLTVSDRAALALAPAFGIRLLDPPLPLPPYSLNLLCTRGSRRSRRTAGCGGLRPRRDPRPPPSPPRPPAPRAGGAAPPDGAALAFHALQLSISSISGAAQLRRP